MPEFLDMSVIDNEIAFEFSGQRTPAVPEHKFTEALLQRALPETGLLPPVVRWMSPTRRWIMLERPPTMQTIKFHAGKPYDIDEGKIREHIIQLPIPWTLHLMMLGSDYYPEMIAVYGLYGPLSSTKNKVFSLPLVNHYTTSALCMPPRQDANLRSVADGIALGYSIAWHAGFNHDLNESIKLAAQYRRPSPIFADMTGRITALKAYRKWSKFSLEEVAGWQDWLRPNGFGAPNTGLHFAGGTMASVDNLIQRAINFDYQRTVGATYQNLTIYCKEAMAAAHLL